MVIRGEYVEIYNKCIIRKADTNISSPKHIFANTHTPTSTASLSFWGRFAEAVGWVCNGLRWILFAEDSDKHPSTSLPLAPSASHHCHRPPPLPLRHPRAHRCCLCLPPSPPSLLPPSFLSGARNVTSISSSGPTRHLCQPSEGASGDCDGTTTMATTTPTLPSTPTLTLALRVREIEEGEKRCGEARVERRCGRRRLDVSRPHVIPSYSTLSVRTSAAQRIYERFSAILPLWKIVIAESSEMTILSKRFLRSNFHTIFFYLSLYQTIYVNLFNSTIWLFSLCLSLWQHMNRSQIVLENKFYYLQKLLSSVYIYARLIRNLF